MLVFTTDHCHIPLRDGGKMACHDQYDSDNPIFITQSSTTYKGSDYDTDTALNCALSLMDDAGCSDFCNRYRSRMNQKIPRLCFAVIICLKR